MIATGYRVLIKGAAFYEDTYVRTPDGWRVSHTGYRRTFELTYSLDDLPGLLAEALLEDKIPVSHNGDGRPDAAGPSVTYRWARWPT